MDESVTVRPATPADVPALEAAMPSRGTAVHAHFLAKQAAGEVSYLVAYVAGQPVGSGVLRWGSHRHVPAGHRFSGDPELSNLGVVPALQGKGIGTALIAAAERLVCRRGQAGVCLSVADDNLGAARLYARLGYEDSGLRAEDRYTYPDQDGVPREIVEAVLVLHKQL